MLPEQNRRERFTAYASVLRERFHTGMLSELQSISQWVVWRSEVAQGKRKKVPYDPHHHLLRASVKIPKSWGSLQEALTALETGTYSGLGFMITPPLVMVDLDQSFDRPTRTITNPQAQEIVQALNSYTEVSPSGTGLHILVYANLPGKGIHRAIEIYGQDRFATITTDHIHGTLTTVAHRQEAVATLYSQFAKVPHPSLGNTRGGLGGVAKPSLSVDFPEPLPSLPEKTDEQVIQEALREERSNFARYFLGDESLWTGPHPLRRSKSEAVFVLILMLLTRTGDNVGQVKRLFKASGLYDEKAQARAGKDPLTGEEVTHLDLAIYNALRKRNQSQRRNPPQ